MRKKKTIIRQFSTAQRITQHKSFPSTYFWGAKLGEGLNNEFEEDPLIRIKGRGDLWQLAYKRHTGRWETLPLEISGDLLRVAGTFEECVSARQSKFQHLLTNL